MESNAAKRDAAKRDAAKQDAAKQDTARIAGSEYRNYYEGPCEPLFSHPLLVQAFEFASMPVLALN